MADVRDDSSRGEGKAKWITKTGVIWFTREGCEWFSQIDCS